jgi:MFS family permease
MIHISLFSMRSVAVHLLMGFCPLMNSARLFSASCVALIVTAMSFALRGGAAGAWAVEFQLTHEQIGWINGTAFWGFTLAMVAGGPLCDTLGLGRFAWMAFFGHLAGILLTVFAWDYASLYAGTLLFGLANGSVEAACNPLIASLYPEKKTTKLNHFHVWFPGGIVIGGLLAFGMGRCGLGWRVQFATMLVPLAVYGWLFLRQKFPRTERVEQGVSTRSMFAACGNPLFLLMALCMLMTAASELGPGQWIPSILTQAGAPGILVLVWITGLMAAGRQFAGPFVHRLSPMGMLFASAVVSAAGLYVMSKSSGGMLYVAATIFAAGVCFFWPTMLGYVSERFPETGALGLAIMGGAGMLSVSFVLPVIGKFYDEGIQERLPAGVTAAELGAAPAGGEAAARWASIQSQAGLESLGRVAVLPVVLAVIFLVLLLTQKKRTPAVLG